MAVFPSGVKRPGPIQKYSVGASLNHLGKKCFAFSSLDKSNIPDVMANV